MEEAKQSLFVVVLWSIWCVHNASIWENKQANLVSTCTLASDLIRDYNWCSNALVPSLLPTRVLSWEKPPVTSLTCMSVELYSRQQESSV
ncbi:unnamed protein product [Trifolium pratense]|uniref:Uncharacterized protein n=1 Tax=Trifolium pratense TaxID=57577 RepID=A0ACB0IZH2_TRIPR|nr:unnamed protein product [Trifolium pratense]